MQDREHEERTDGAPQGQDTVDGAGRPQPRVVVGVDGSDAGQAALGAALVEARLRHAVLQVVHAWQYPFELTATSYAVPVPAGDMAQWAAQVIDDALDAAGAGDAPDVVRQAVNGTASAVLADAARGAALLVVGTRGHNRLTGLFLGSVSQFLAVHAPCPVLVVHGPSAGNGARGQGAGTSAVPAVSVVSHGAAGTPGSPALVEIPEDECLALLGSKQLGRLVVVHGGVPQAYPVNYVLDGRTVAMRTDPGMLLDWATLGQVAFEVDEIDEGTREGWSVVVHGIGRDVTDGVDAWSEHVRSRTLEPWAGGERRHWVALASTTFTGRRLVRHGAAPDRRLAPA